MTSHELMIADNAGSTWALIDPQHPGVSLDPGGLSGRLRSPVWKGYALIVVFALGFGGWAAYAPLAGGAIASGVVSPQSSRRLVQHLEGGIIREFKVAEGDVVREGQELIVLEPLQARAAHEALLAQSQSLLARKLRLEAEKSNATSIVFTAELHSAGVLAPLAASQKEIFEARLAAHEMRRSVLQQRTVQLEEQIKGYSTQIASINTQLSLIHEEVAGKEKLLDQGLVSKPEALRLRRSESELTARRAEFETEIIKTKQQIGEASLQILSADALRRDEITSELDKVTSELADVRERLRTSEDVLNRTVITAPAGGTVMNLRFKTVGGVLQRGEPVLEIVPNDDALIIEARVSPNDIRLVHAGQVAQIHLSGYSSRLAPRITGTVRSASPDRVTDPSGHQSYFLARVEVNREELRQRASDITLIPGMSAEVIFVTEERTLLEYLLNPITSVLRRAMREA